MRGAIVNNDDKCKEQWFPWLVVDPVDASVNIAYYDRAVQAGTLTDVTLARRENLPSIKGAE